MRATRKLLLLFIAILPLLVGCASTPLWSHDEASEVEDGELRHKQVLESMPEYGDEKLAAFVSAVGNRLASVSERPTLKWQFTVLDSPVENAFATMGGHVYITRGMLAYLRDESDLAAVLAHEIAHICRRDAVHANRRSTMAGIAALGVIVAAPITLLFPRVVGAPLGMGLSAVSRADEAAADQLGAAYLARAGYRAEAMQGAMEVLSSIETYRKSLGLVGEGWWHRAYADHPETAERQERLATLTGSPRPDVKETVDTKFLALLDGMEVGNSSGQGIIYKGKRYFPDLDISLQIPSGWQVRAWRGRNGQAPTIWLTNEKRTHVFIVQKRPIVDLAENVCDSMGHTFERMTLEARVPLRGNDGSTCTTLGSTTFGLFSKTTAWHRVGIVRLNKEHYLTFGGYVPSQQKGDEEFNAIDQSLLDVAKSIELRAANTKAPERPRLRIHKAKRDESFEKLAASSTMPIDNVSFLRAINHRSAQTEVAAGDVIKIVK